MGVGCLGYARCLEAADQAGKVLVKAHHEGTQQSQTSRKTEHLRCSVCMQQQIGGVLLCQQHQ